MKAPVHLLLAHGSRDPEWREPFEQIASDLQKADPGRVVILCYLELWAPALAEAVRDAYARGARSFRISPLFWSRGRHLRKDLPETVDSLLQELPDCSITVDLPAGESGPVRAAVVRFLS